MTMQDSVTQKQGRWALRRPDLLAGLALAALAWLFFWRVLTPTPTNQLTFVEGDFTGQFVSFAHYQAARLGAGQIPLWNPYNYGGHPFVADTQAAAFYPPRLITIGLLNASGPLTPQRVLDALQREAIAHTVLASWFMYAFVRRLTRHQAHSVPASLVSALTFAYGGYLTSYPLLQLAVIEAGIWLPLILLGIYQATRLPLTSRPAVGHAVWCLGLSGVALGLSLLAGHPQTTLYIVYVLTAFLVWRAVEAQWKWWQAALALASIGAIAGGLAAVQLLPGIEYLLLTTRNTLGFEALSNGFPFYDLLQVLFPGFISLWSPLYLGIAGLLLACFALMNRERNRDVWFWGGVVLVGLLLSVGRHSIVFDVFYNVMPGFSLFRGQERSAYLITLAAAILSGYGAAALLNGAFARGFGRLLVGITALTGVVLLILFSHWLLVPTADVNRLGLVAFSTLLAGAAMVILPRRIPWMIVLLVIVDLFTVGRSNPNFVAIPLAERLQPSPLNAAMKPLEADPASAIHGVRADGLRENFGTLYSIPDIQGISPLQLASVERARKFPNGRAWEIFAVRYVITPDAQLPVPSTIQAQVDDPRNPFKLHELTTQRPFARMVYRWWVEADPAQAAGLLSDPSFPSQTTVLLNTTPAITEPATAPLTAKIVPEAVQPEYLRLQVETAESGILNLALINYPGWHARIDGQPTALLLADTVMVAIPLQAGRHTVELTYDPFSFRLGLGLTLTTLGGLLALLIIGGIRVRFRTSNRTTEPTIESAIEPSV